MLEDVEQHLLEVAAEGDDPLETRLGPPVEYAAELRAAAGLPKRTGDEDPFAQRIAARISASRLVRWVERDLAALERHSSYREMRAFTRSLQPAWWLARAYIVTMVIGLWTNNGLHHVSLVPRVADTRLMGLLVLVVLSVASIAWSRRARNSSKLRFLTVIGNMLAAVAAVVFVANAGDMNRSYFYVDAQPQPQYDPNIVRGPYGNILNIYPYALDGTPLKDVLLFDQNGNPIPGVVMDRLTQERLPRDQRGQLIPNVFPYPEAVIDSRTGEIVGERPVPPVPLRVPPKLPEPSMSAQTSPSADVPSSVVSPTAAASASSAPSVSGSATSPSTVVPSPAISPSPSPSATR